MPKADSPPAPTRLAVRLAQAGLLVGCAPWLFIVPLTNGGMNFMLWTWIWPLLTGIAAVGAGGLSLGLRDPRARRLAWAAVALGLLSVVAAIAGFTGMVASMRMG